MAVEVPNTPRLRPEVGGSTIGQLHRCLLDCWLRGLHRHYSMAGTESTPAKMQSISLQQEGVLEADSTIFSPGPQSVWPPASRSNDGAGHVCMSPELDL